MMLSHSLVRAFNSEAKKTAPGRCEDQPRYRVVIPIGSTEQRLYAMSDRFVKKDKRNIPSRRLHNSFPYFLY